MRTALGKGVASLVLGAMLLSGCVYTNVQLPLSTEFNRTELGSKTGTSSSQSILWLVAWGDAGTKAAAQEGGITVIRHADRKVFCVLFGLYYKMTTVVYGE
jgi:hypothetical protein